MKRKFLIATTWAYLLPKQRVVFGLLIVAQLLVNFIDLVGLAAVGLLIMALASGEIDFEVSPFFRFRIDETSPGFVVGLVALAALAFLVKALANLLLTLAQIRYTAWIEVEASRRVASFLLSGNLERIRRFSQADVQFVVNSSTSAMFSGILNAAASIVVSFSLLALILGAFVLLNPLAALIIASYLILIISAIQSIISRRLVAIGKMVRKFSIRSGGTILDAVATFKEIAVLSKQNFFLGRFAEAKALLAKTNASSTVLRIVPRIIIEQGLLIGVLGFVAFQVASGGDLAEGFAVIGIFVVGSIRIIGAVLPIQNALSNLKTLGAKAEMAMSLFQEMEQSGFGSGTESLSSKSLHELKEATTAECPTNKGYSVSMRGVRFAYPGSDADAVSNLSVEIPGGSFVALVGPSGAGKTTIADIILGLNEPLEGEITVDGRSPNEVRKHRPGSISYVPQRPGMVSGTIAQNVALGVGLDEIDADRVWECLRIAALDEVVESLPHGIHSRIGKQRDQLSGGQLQRLGLARALYSKPRLIILDEATSALDAQSEAAISNNIRQLGSDVTLVVIAHRLSTVKHADSVYAIDDGKLIGAGPFNTLRKQVPIIEQYVRLMSFDAAEE